eukprot:TRINITY_DN80340_c0_g1_i1.p1 TRINITY_DN80340_c0_g1~~TRINITY_DN80340_c0_g1_i1.p1  ORF type:complete len:616 (+),score=173.60 TRINITY_DN80340_c0_g1_i1:105-1952(+)
MSSLGPEVSWEVLRPSCPVRAEPHLDGEVLGRKRRGERIKCSEITLDGWLKLSCEKGWMLSDMQGLQGLGALMEPTGQDLQLAVDEPQPQGICCLEVVYSQVAVRAFPSRDAVALYYRRKGELVFASSQNFDGWLKLAGEEGWMLTFAADHGTLLRARDSKVTVDLWALSDLWAALRRKRRILSTSDVKLLKEAEESTLLMSDMDYEHHVKTGNADPLVEDGLLTEADLKRPHSWIRQRLFAQSLLRMAQEEPPLSDLCPDMQLTSRPLPMELFDKASLAEADTTSASPGSDRKDVFEAGNGAKASPAAKQRSGGSSAGYNSKIGLDSLLGDLGGDGRGQRSRANGCSRGRGGRSGQGAQPGARGAVKSGMSSMDIGDSMMVSTLEIDGETFLVTQDGMVLDPETQTPVGMFNPETNEVQELNEEMLAAALGQVSMVELNGRPYLFMNGLLVDPQTQAIAYQVEADGTLVDAATGEICGTLEMTDSDASVLVQPSEGKAKGPKGPSGAFGFEDENLDAFGWAERAKELVADDYFYQAAAAFGEALKCCEDERAVELEFECELLRGRASCWRKMREFKPLLEDAEKLLSYDADDAEAEEWKKLAMAELRSGFGVQR